MASSNQEVEIKFRIADIQALTGTLQSAGFHLVTARTHEMNALFDLEGNVLRGRSQLLRLREYGNNWTLTFKDKAAAGRHKSRPEIETRVENGPAMMQILESLGYQQTFAYEKYRSEWGDDGGHVVVDETPIGNFGEIEGEAEWIDRVAARLGVAEEQYITASYTELFRDWKLQTRSRAENMLFAETGSR